MHHYRGQPRRARSDASSAGGDPGKVYSDEVSYKIDYLSKNHMHGGDEVFETMDGEEPKPANLARGYHYSMTLPAIEVHRKFEASQPYKYTSLRKLPTVLRINSHYLINALETILGDPQGLSTFQDRDHRFETEEPYKIIVNHLDELRNYRSNHPDEEDLGITVCHIELLLEFIRKAIGAELEAEAHYNSQEVPLVTWDWLWTAFKDDETVYTSSSVPRAYILNSITGGYLSGSKSTADGFPWYSDGYTVSCWALKFNGLHYIRKSKTFRIPRFMGPRELATLPVYPARFVKTTGEGSLHKKLVERGRKVYELHKASPSHREYNGLTFDRQAREVSVALSALD